MSYGTLISTQTIGAGGAASIDFNSIPQTYTDLLLVVSGRLNSTSGDLQIRFNGSSSTFTIRYMDGSGTAASSGTNTSAGYVAKVNPSSYTANTFSNQQTYIPNYTGSTNKVFSTESVNENNATAGYAQISAGLWATTSAITSISILDFSATASFVQYSTASLYGIK